MASEAARCEAGSLLLTNRTASGRSVTLDESTNSSTAEPDHHAGAGRSNARWIRLCRHKSSSASRCADLSFRPKVSPNLGAPGAPEVFCRFSGGFKHCVSILRGS